MDAQTMTAAIAEKERELGEIEARIAARQEQVVLGKKLSAELRDALGCDDAGLPLPLAPLVAYRRRRRERGDVLLDGRMAHALPRDEWNMLLVVSLALGVVSIPLSKRAGAGGMARLGLRRFAIVGVALALLGVLAAVVAPRGH